MTFLGANDYLVLEKASGQVKRVISGVLQLHPDFPADPPVYNTGAEIPRPGGSGPPPADPARPA